MNGARRVLGLEGSIFIYTVRATIVTYRQPVADDLHVKDKLHKTHSRENKEVVCVTWQSSISDEHAKVPKSQTCVGMQDSITFVSQ